MSDAGLGALLEPPAAYPIAGPAAGANGVVVGGPGRLTGWTAYVAPRSVATQDTNVANPAPGADFHYTVPANTTQDVLTVEATLTTSATVANRVPQLEIWDASANVVVTIPVPAAQAATAVVTYQFEIQGADQAPVGGVSTIDIPELSLGAGWSVHTVTQAIQAGDQWSNIWVTTTGPAAAVLTLYDGQDATGQVVATIGGQAGFTDSDNFAPNGIRVTRGLYVVGNAAVTLTAVYFIPEGPGRS